MGKLKEFARYILFLIGAYLLTNALIFIGFNLNYSDISLTGEVPAQISIEKAEATNKDGRIYGYVSNERENNVNGKYIKISVYNMERELLTTEYLKINDVEYGNKRLFRSKFAAKGAASYSISIVDEENK